MRVVATNKRGRYDYAIERTIRAGIVLNGIETKSIRAGHASMKGSFAHIRDGELWVINMHVSPYTHADAKNYEPTRPRKLLVTARELADLKSDKLAGRSIVPLALLAGRYIKIELGIGPGKKKYDKRQVIKARDIARSNKNNMDRS